MAWMTLLTRTDGAESVLGIHEHYRDARQQAEDFNRRYQIRAARVEPFDPARLDRPA